MTDSTPRRQYRRTIQISRSTHDALSAYADRVGSSKSSVVEQILRQPMAQDVVERARENGVAARAVRARIASRAGVTARRQLFRNRPGSSLVNDITRAVAYSYLHKVSIECAAEEYDVPLRQVIALWHQTHDEEPKRRNRSRP